jgi:hypothetical protein
MSAKLDPAPAIRSLEKAGWHRGRQLPDRHNVYEMVSPDGQDHRVQFRGRSESENSVGQYLYGIFYCEFDTVDEMVLWSRLEESMLVLPTAWLRQLFDENSAKIDGDRWHVNVYFDKWPDCAWVVPVNYYDGRFKVPEEYVVPFDAT